jgi:hypothetical protein
MIIPHWRIFLSQNGSHGACDASMAAMLITWLAGFPITRPARLAVANVDANLMGFKSSIAQL